VQTACAPWTRSRKGWQKSPSSETEVDERGFARSFSATMVKGQKVVCINDTFSDFIRAIYKQLPVKSDTYTIREVFLGREKIVKGGDSATVGLLLEELVNPPDPFHQGQQELGFSSERFAPLEELPPEEAAAEEEQELELVGPGPGKHGWENN
jgi:hypothetical protein